MASTFTFELVSPERLLISRSVSMVTVPGAEGYLGILPGHAPLMTTLQAGILSVHENGRITERLFVTGGFVEVTQDHCTVLADQITAVADLDPTILTVDMKALLAQA